MVLISLLALASVTLPKLALTNASIFAFSIGYAIAGGFTLPVIIGVVFLVGYVLIVLALIGGGAHFRRKTPAR